MVHRVLFTAFTDVATNANHADGISRQLDTRHRLTQRPLS